MLRCYLVFTTSGTFCIEDDSEHGACESALLNFDYPEFERVTSVIEVNVNCYPY
jgi:hypothetical protein